MISEWDSAVPAIVQSWYSGMEGGNGLADVLSGDADASGRLPFSVPRSESDLPNFESKADAFVYDAWHGYWHLKRQGAPPAYPFGFGLSYTAFALEQAEGELVGDEIRIAASVRNSGDRHGTDVVQVYGHRQDTSRPARLVAFDRLELEAGETARIELAVGLSALAERDVASHSMVVRSGVYGLRVAHHAEDPGIELTVAIDKEVQM